MMMGGGLGGMGMPGMGGPGSDEPARKDVLGDGTVFKEVLEAGEQYGRQPEPGDECVVSWTEIAGEEPPALLLEGDALGDAVLSAATKAIVVVGEPGVSAACPAGVAAALKAMVSGEVAKVQLRDGAGSSTDGAWSCCRVELVSFWPAEDVSEARDGSARKKSVSKSDDWQNVNGLDVVDVDFEEGVSWLASQPTPAGERPKLTYSGRARDLKPTGLALAACAAPRGETSLAKVADGRVFRLTVTSCTRVVDCSAAQDESLLKTELDAGADWERPGARCDAAVTVARACYAKDGADVEAVASNPAVAPAPGDGDPMPPMVDAATFDEPVRLALRKMKRNERARVVASPRASDGAALTYELVLHGWRDDADVDDGVRKKVLDAAPEGHERRKPEALDVVTVSFGSLELEAAGGFEAVDDVTLPTTTWKLDEDDATCPGLEAACEAMKVGETALVTVAAARGFAEPRAPAFSRLAGVGFRVACTLEAVDRFPPSYELKAPAKIERGEALKARGNAWFANKTNLPRAIRRYGGAIDCCTSAYEKDLDADGLKRRLALLETGRANRAAAHLAAGDFAKGKADCDAVLKENPAHAKAHFRRGQCCLKLDDWAEARKSFRFCLALDGGNKDAARGLRTIADLKRKQDAKDRETFALDKLAKALHDDAAPAAAPAAAAAAGAAADPGRTRALVALAVAGALAAAAVAWAKLAA